MILTIWIFEYLPLHVLCEYMVAGKVKFYYLVNIQYGWIISELKRTSFDLTLWVMKHQLRCIFLRMIIYQGRVPWNESERESEISWQTFIANEKCHSRFPRPLLILWFYIIPFSCVMPWKYTEVEAKVIPIFPMWDTDDDGAHFEDESGSPNTHGKFWPRESECGENLILGSLALSPVYFLYLNSRIAKVMLFSFIVPCKKNRWNIHVIGIFQRNIVIYCGLRHFIWGLGMKEWEKL